MASISPFIHLSCFFFYFQKFPLEKFSLWHEKNKMIVRTCCFYCFTIEQFPIECGKYDFGFALLCCVNGPEYLSHYFKHFSFAWNVACQLWLCELNLSGTCPLISNVSHCVIDEKCLGRVFSFSPFLFSFDVQVPNYYG